jgi:hypothetical protein
MVDQVQDRSPDGPGDGDPRETGQPKRDASDGRSAEEHKKAETEVAAGDVADDLADFA